MTRQRTPLQGSQGVALGALINLRLQITKFTSFAGGIGFISAYLMNRPGGPESQLNGVLFPMMAVVSLIILIWLQFWRGSQPMVALIQWVAHSIYLFTHLAACLFYLSNDRNIELSKILFPLMPWMTCLVPAAYLNFERRMARFASNGYVVFFAAIVIAYSLGLGDQQSLWVILALVLNIGCCVLFNIYFDRFAILREQSIEITLHAHRHGVQALADELTQMPNRRALRQKLEQCLERLKRNAEQFGVIMIDLDHFKMLNDKFGHERGDTALRVVAGILKEATRLSDMCGRWGGEEFMLIVSLSSEEGLKKHSERVRYLIEKTRGSELPPMTASLGVTMAHADDDIESLTKRTDSALIEAKEKGRNRCVILLPAK